MNEEKTQIDRASSEVNVDQRVIKPTYYFAVFINADFYKINYFNTFVDKHPIEIMIDLSAKNKTLTLLSWQEVDEKTYLKYKNSKAISQIDQ